MSRLLRGDETEVFRAVIEWHYPATDYKIERTIVEYAGPFSTIGAAKTIVTSAIKNLWYADRVTGRVESTVVNWREVE